MDLTTLNSDDLINLRIEVEKEIRLRGLSFSVGEVGEKLAVKYFIASPGLPNLTVAQTGTKNVDAWSRKGERYSIKTVQKGSKTGTIYPDEQDQDKQLFEYLLIIKLTADFSMKFLYEFSWKQFLEVRAWDKRMNAWYVPVSKARLKLGKCLYIKDRGE